MLDINVEVRKSKIAGRAVFALQDFRAGEVVFDWDTSNVLTDEQYARLPDDQKQYVVRYGSSWVYMLEPMRYVNHSCEPNTVPIRSSDVAARNIKAGEEITSDYRSVMPKGESMICHCGASSCAGTIVGTAI
jgi:hypothetical protein